MEGPNCPLCGYLLKWANTLNKFVCQNYFAECGAEFILTRLILPKLENKPKQHLGHHTGPAPKNSEIGVTMVSDSKK